MSQVLSQLQNVTASDIINVGTDLKNKNLQLTEVKMFVHDNHIIVRDRDDHLLSWIKRQPQTVSG